MENMNTDSGFKYTYSAKEQDEIKRIRQKYQTQEEDGINRLRRLDAEVTSKATGIALAVGIVGTLTMGTGMSLIMTDIAEKIGFSFDPMFMGIVIGSIGMLMAIINYPIYKAILGSRKKKYSGEIFRLSNKILNK